MSVRRKPVRRRGQPLVALMLLMVSWVGARAALWETPIPAEQRAAAAVRPAPKAKRSPPRSTAPKRSVRPVVVPAPRPSATLPAPQSVPPAAPEAASTGLPPPVVASGTGDAVRPAKRPSIADLEGHQELYSAAMAVPTIDEASAADVPRQRRLPFAAALVQPAGSRWSGDAWLLVREGGNGTNAPGAGVPGAIVPAGFYGASQVGAVLRFRLDRSSALQPSVYLRATSALQHPRGEEVAAGLAIRPFAAAPIQVMGEARITNTSTGTIVRPAAIAVSQLPPARLPLGLRAEAYAQAGYVGGRGATAFVDGQARLERNLVSAGRWQLRAGGGTWGGAQKGAKRLDVGPTATLDVPLGPVTGRLAADWRFRVAGNAAPTSGPALTLSAGF